MHEIAMILRARLGDSARRVTTRTLPNGPIRIAALFMPDLKQIAPELGLQKSASGDKARRVLDWSPRSKEDAIVATAHSLQRLGLVKPA